jgi:hypothetical protein
MLISRPILEAPKQDAAFFGRGLGSNFLSPGSCWLQRYLGGLLFSRSAAAADSTMAATSQSDSPAWFSICPHSVGSYDQEGTNLFSPPSEDKLKTMQANHFAKLLPLWNRDMAARFPGRHVGSDAQLPSAYALWPRTAEYLFRWSKANLHHWTGSAWSVCNTL